MAIHVALDPNNSAAQNKTELVNALNSYTTRGGEIRLPRSEQPFNIDPGIVWPNRRNIDLVGEGVADGYEDGFGGTQLKFTSGAVGIDMSQININDPAFPYARVQNISFHGNNVCQIGLKVGGISHIEHVEVKNCTQANISATQLVNTVVLDHVSVIGGGNIGLWIGSENGGSNPNNTRMTVNDLRARANQVGVRMEQAQGVRFNGGVIEANYKEGMVLYRPSNRVLDDIVIRDIWFEANWRGALGYAVVVDGGAAPKNVRFQDCIISVGGQSKAMRVAKVDGGLVFGLRGDSGAIDLESGCSNFGLVDLGSGFTVTDNGTANFVKSLSQIGSGGGGGGGGAWPITVEFTLPDANQTLTAGQLVNGLLETFFTANRNVYMPNATDIIAAMGGYVQGATAEFTIMNRTSGSAVVVLLNGTGTTVKGNNQIALGSGLFAVRIDSPTAVSVINKSRN